MYKAVLAFLAKYFSKELLKEALLASANSFKETLWGMLKEEIHIAAREVVADAEKFLVSFEAQEKEEVILSVIMEKINLPLLLKPFKGIIRKILKNKLEEVIRQLLNKGKEFIG